jgi:glycosyltransferase involved in cell wall biosynthesis
MNILEITSSFGLGGTQKVMQIYCKYLDKRKIEIYTCALKESGPREKIFLTYSKDALVADGNLEKIIAFIKKNKIELIHWHNINRRENVALTIKILQYCSANHIKVIETSPFSTFHKDIDSLIFFRFFVSKANLLKFLWRYGNQIEDKNKYSFIYNPLDIENLSHHILKKTEVNILRKEIGLKSDDYVIGKIGRADIWKWSDEIIDVVPYLIKTIPHLKVVVRALPKQKLEKIKNKKLHKYFILLPETVDERDLYETYQLIDILFHTSRIGECNSIAINEAMFFGLPIITNSTDFKQFTLFDRDNGQTEIVDNGVNGFIENDIQEMAEKVILLYRNKNLYKKINLANKKKARELFNAKAIVRQFEDIALNNNKQNTRVSIENYQKRVLKNTLPELLKLNLKTIYEYLRFIKFHEKF